MTKQTPCNYRTPPKYHVDYLDEQMVIVNGVSYTRTEPTPIVIQEDENTIVVGGIKYQKIEESNPQRLYETLCKIFYGSNYVHSDEICDVVEKWLPAEVIEDGEEYNSGWNACLKYLRENIK